MNNSSTLEKALEISVYLSVFFMQIAKGEGITDVFIFGSFIMWLFVPRYRKYFLALKSAVIVLFFITVAVIPISVIFSIDPFYSFREMLKEPLKAAIFLPVIATVMADEVKLKRLLLVMSGAAAIIVFIAFYSYVLQGEKASPNTFLLHAHPNRFSKHLNTFMPFIIASTFIWKGWRYRLAFSLLLIATTLSLCFSGSRGGFCSFILLACIWGFYLWRKEGVSITAMLLITATIVISIGAVSWFSPYARNKIKIIPEQMTTIGDRTSRWESAFSAFKERPILGWGYGEKIFNRQEPYKRSGMPVPSMHPHNTFIKVLFHQGLLGFLPYIALILFSIIHFWRSALAATGIRGYLFCGCVAGLTAVFLFHSITEIMRLHYLALILGIGLAATALENEGEAVSPLHDI